MTPRDRDALLRILECIEAVDAYVSRAGMNWPADGMAVDAIAKRIEEIGEVAKRLAPETVATMPGVDWRGVRAIREVLAHDYDEVDAELLAGIVRDNLPDLRAAVSEALSAS